MGLASVGYVGYGVESTEGTLVAPTIFLPVSSFSVDSTNDYIIPEQLRGSRDHSILLPSAYSVSGSMEMQLVPNGIANLLKSALGHVGTITPSAYQTTAYLSSFTPGVAAVPTFSFETSAADILIMRYGGMRVNTLEINAAFNEVVTATFGLEGTTRAKQVSLSTESYDSVLPFHFTGVAIRRDGVDVGNVKNFTFSLGNNIDRVGTLRRTRSWSRTQVGMRNVGLTCTMDFQDTTDYDLFLAETEFSVDLLMEGDYLSGSSGPKNALHITIPRVRWNSIGAPLTAGDMIEQNVEATIVRPLNGNPILSVDLVNNESVAF